MTITIAALVRRNDWSYAVPITPSGVNQKGVICLIKGSVKIWDMEITASAVLAFGDDEVNSAFDVGVVLMDGCSDIAV
jgi:hypothetical protein